jgi:hypothetical protein
VFGTTADGNFSLDCDRLPLILAGPMLRRTEPEAVTIWLALKAPRRVTLRIYATRDGRELQQNHVLLEGSRATIQLGHSLYIVAVTAAPLDSHRLKPGQIYTYDLTFGNPAESLSSALNAPDFPYTTVSYFEHHLPTFALPPEDLNDLKIVHTSCNKPHGGGRDVFPLLDGLLEQTAPDPYSRPHQLFLTGDQIYADDVADPLLWATQVVSRALLGWEDTLLLGNNPTKPSELQPGQRSEIAETWGGFTAMLPHKPENAKSHLLSWGEYCAMYLLVWSPVLWPDRFPAGQKVCTDGKLAQQWDREVKAIAPVARELRRVRRALANIPTYTIFDDHEISDDWYLNREWCDRVPGKPFGRQVLQNGLLAYALFQAWGNTPEQFAAGQPGEKLLQAAEQWSISAGNDEKAWHEIGEYLGMPDLDPQTGLPKFKRDREVLILARSDRALDWHYTVRSPKHEVIVTDTRTWRGYPVDAPNHAPPMLLCPTAFEQQLEHPLARANETNVEATLVVLPTNLVSLGIIDRVHHWELQRGNTFGSDVGDSWNIHSEAFIQLLETLTQQRDRLIILSGDIHYSCAVRLTYWSHSSSQTGVARPVRAAVLAQLTSSAIKNADWKTYLIHTKIKSLLPERPEYWLGWHEPSQPIKIPRRRLLGQPRNLGKPPDWFYRIEWIERQAARSVSWGKQQPDPEFEPKPTLGSKILDWLLLGLWRNRWLQEGKEVVGRNNFSIISFAWPPGNEVKAVIQDTHWHPPWEPTRFVKSRYVVPLQLDELP